MKTDTLYLAEVQARTATLGAYTQVFLATNPSQYPGLVVAEVVRVLTELAGLDRASLNLLRKALQYGPMDDTSPEGVKAAMDRRNAKEED